MVREAHEDPRKRKGLVARVVVEDRENALRRLQQLVVLLEIDGSVPVEGVAVQHHGLRAVMQEDLRQDLVGVADLLPAGTDDVGGHPVLAPQLQRGEGVQQLAVAGEDHVDAPVFFRGHLLQLDVDGLDIIGLIALRPDQRRASRKQQDQHQQKGDDPDELPASEKADRSVVCFHCNVTPLSMILLK